jgi:hypothetical protein
MKKFIVTTIMTTAVLLSISAQKYRPAISILGDSYSTFDGFMTVDTNKVWYFPVSSTTPYRDSRNGNDVKRVEDTWWHQLIANYGYRLCTNNSFSGATICYTGYRDRTTGKPQDYANRSFENRITNLGCPDIILICGATNDSWCGAPIGEYKYSDWTTEDLKSFRPAMAKMLYKAQTYYPNVPIYFILNSELKESINESVRTICRYYGVKLIELHDIDKQGGHPSIQRMKTFAEQVGEVLKQLRIDNQ